MTKKSKKLLGRAGGLAFLAIAAIIVNFNIDFNLSVPDQNTVSTPAESIEIHFIDVGQGDSILIETAEASMLIDAGENHMGDDVVRYLENEDVDRLAYVIGTHPHSDHIGGLDTVINSIPVENIILPDVVHTTKTFEDVLDAIEKNDLKITKAVPGEDYQLGPATFTIVSPISTSYKELNNYSVGVKITYGDNTFLMTGDAEVLSEKEMLNSGIDLSADVLKLSHHGSETSSSEEFIAAVNPSYCVISVGEDNEYGHPDGNIMKLMEDKNIEVYRTDKQGSVVFTVNDKTISANTSAYDITDTDIDN